MKSAIIINDTSYKPHHGCETVVDNIKYLLEKKEIQTIATNPVGEDWKKNKFLLEKMKEADIVVVNGEGTLHHQHQRVEELVSVGRYVKENFNIPIVLINTTYQDNGSEIAKYVKYFDLVFVRESYSQKDLEQWGIQSKVVPDMTFYSTYQLDSKKIRKYIGVTDSVYSDLSKKLYSFTQENGYIFLPVLAVPKINKFKYMTSGLKVIRFTLFKNIKTLLLKLGIPLNYKKIRTQFYMNNYDDYISSIENLKIFITGRFHSLCFALKTLTPFLVIKSNSHKIEGMLTDIGIGLDRIKSFEEIKQGDMEEYIQFSSEEKQKIEHYITQAPLKIEQMFDDIESLLNV